MILDSVIARARPGCVVVFDLDSTLLDNRPRQSKILREFGAAQKLAALAKTEPKHWAGWDIRIAMANAGLSAAEVEKWGDAAKQFWRDRFFTSDYAAVDDAVVGAVEFVARLTATGVQIAYCTGRHHAMREGTIASFRRLGLPLPDDTRVHLLTKPTFDMDDDAWKELAYAELRALGEVIACFDNEPTHVNGYRSAFPDALIIHLDTDHSGRNVKLAAHITSIKDFS